MPMYPKYHQTPLLRENGDRYEDDVLWKIHYVAQLNEPRNQVPEIRTQCRYCDAPLKVADGWLPH